MPTYRFQNEIGEEYEEFMSISQLDLYLKENKVTQLVNGAPALVSGRGMGKPDNGFRDLLTNIKEKHSKGISDSTVNNF